jgi:HEAT repeat protein
MLAFCPNCWNAISASPATCRNCGTRVDVYSHDYESQPVSLLPHSHAAKRVEICLVLGQRQKRSAVPHLTGLLTATSMLVRVAALRALSEIGNGSAIPI